jgi:LppX_LprAFG lipoprotein
MSALTPRRRALRRVAALTATPVLLVALTACGGDDSEQATDEPAGASSSSSDEPAADDDAADESDSEPAEGEEVDKDEFIADFQEGVEQAGTAHMTMSTGASGTTLDAEGEVDYSTTPPSMAMTMTSGAMGDQPIDIRLVDGVFYMNMGQMSQDKFYKFDLDDKNGPMGDMSSLTESMDPVKSFEQFTAGLDSVVYVGEEDVDGEDLDHYLLSLDTSKIESMQGEAGAGLPKELEYDLWLDDDNRMRQVQIDVAQAQVDMKIFDWDEPVDIEAPDASEVTELPGS